MSAKIYAFLPFGRYRRHKSLIVADQLGVHFDRPRYFFSLSSHERDFGRSFFLQHHLNRKKVVSFHHLASSLARSLQDHEARSLVSFLTNLGYTVLIVSSDQVSPFLSQMPNVVVYHSKNILKTAALLERCVAHVGINSGIAHVAAAVGKPCFVLDVRNIWMENSRVLEPHSTHYLLKRYLLSEAEKALKRFLNAKQ